MAIEFHVADENARMEIDKFPSALMQTIGVWPGAGLRRR